MTKILYSSPAVIGTTGFRDVAKEVSDALIACGLVRKTVTGQIDWAAVGEFSAANTVYGFEIFELADSQSTALPVVIKLEYGRGTSVVHQFWITVGSGHDPAGNISGVYFPRRLCCNSNVGYANPNANHPTAVCVTDGFAGFSFKMTASPPNAPRGGFLLGRSVDSSGNPNADGLVLVTGAGSGANTVTSCYLASSASEVTSTLASTCLVPFAQTSALVGGDAQVFKHYVITPRVRPTSCYMSVLSADIGSLSTFECAPVGARQRTFLVCSPYTWGITTAGGAIASSLLAMLWE